MALFYRLLLQFLFLFLFFSSSVNAYILETKHISVFVNFTTPLSKDLKKYYYSKGVETIVYAGNLKYYFYGDRDMLLELDNNQDVIEIKEIDYLDKVQHDFIQDIENSSEVVELKVLLFKIFDEEKISSMFKHLDAYVTNIQNNSKLVTIKLPRINIYDLLDMPLVQYVEKSSKKLEIKSNYLVYSAKAAKLSRTNILWDSPYLLSGKGVKVAIIDEGIVRVSHQEFKENGYSRVNIGLNSGYLSAHSTHVAGIIGSYGINPDAHGMANRVSMYSYYFNDFAFVGAMLKSYEDANILLSNHSYGYFFKVYLGIYNTDAMAIDKSVYENPYLNAFIASGNDRNKNSYKKYGITKGPVNAKNILTIGAVNDEGIALADFSSTGPVLDGRIKPDLVANGTMLYSTGINSDSDYFFMGGTSMATPVATGIAALMMEEYKNITNKNIRHDLLKAVLINTAIDRGRIGPDYEYGYGLIDSKVAIDLIKTLKYDDRYIKNEIIEDKQIKDYCIDNRVEGNLKTTIVWIDPEGNPAHQDKTLVNDIDILIKKENYQIGYPFSLDKENPTLPASVDTPNKIDNIEQIELFASDKSGIILNVKGTQIVTQKQNFSLVSNKPFVKLPSSPLNVKALPIDNYTVHIFWQDTSNNEQKFDIYRDGKLICTTKANKEDMIDNKLQSNTVYRYKVSATDLCGRESFSKIIYIKTPNKINAPSNFQINTIGKNAIFLKWQDNSCNEKGFYIYKNDKLINVLSKNQTSFLDRDINADKIYKYKIIAFNDSEISCSLDGKSDLFVGNILKSSTKKHYFSLDNSQLVKIFVKLQHNEKYKSIKVVLKSIETGKIYNFHNLHAKNSEEHLYYISQFEIDILASGNYEVSIENGEIKDNEIFSSISFSESLLQNFSRIIFKNINNY